MSPAVPPRRRLAARLGLAAFALLLFALAAEGALRLAGVPMPRVLTKSLRGSPRMAPGAEFVYRGYLEGAFIDFENPVRLNAQGFHDRDYADARPRPGTYRVLVLGDSYVAALSVPLDRIFHKQIEDRLNREDPLGAGRYEVIALGRGNQGQGPELAWLQEFGPRYTPDLVLLVFFCGNDIMENSPAIFSRAGSFARFYTREVAPRKAQRFEQLLWLPGSRLNGLVAEALTQRYAGHLDRYVPGLKAEDLESPELGVYRAPPTAEWQDAFGRTGALLAQLRDACAAQHTKFALACLAGPQAIGDVGNARLRRGGAGLDLDQPERWVMGWCATNGVPAFSLKEPLRRAGPHRVFWRHDGHLDPFGNTAAADALYPFVVEQARRR